MPTFDLKPILDAATAFSVMLTGPLSFVFLGMILGTVFALFDRGRKVEFVIFLLAIGIAIGLYVARAPMEIGPWELALIGVIISSGIALVDRGRHIEIFVFVAEIVCLVGTFMFFLGTLVSR